MVAQRCATPSRPPCGALAATASSRSSCCPCQRLPFLMAKSSCADKTILKANMLTNTCVLEQVWLWYIDVISFAWVSCRCEMCKHQLFRDIFLTDDIFHQRRPKADMNIFLFWAPFSILRFLGKDMFIHKKRLKHGKTREPKTQEAQS